MTARTFESGHAEAEFRAHYMMVTDLDGVRTAATDFGVSWQDELPGGGVVVSNEIAVTLAIEAIADEDLERTGAIE